MNAKHIRPAVYLTDTVDPAPGKEITGIIAYQDTDNTLNLTIYGQQYPCIILDAEDLAALTNLLNQGAKPQPPSGTVTLKPTTTAIEYNIEDIIPDNAVAYYGGRFMLDLQPEPAQMGARAACTQALEHIDVIDHLLEIIWPDHNIAATAEEYLSGLITMIQTRLTHIEDAIAAQSPILSPKSPIPSPHNATLPAQEDAPS